MAAFLNWRRKLELFLIALLTLFAFASSGDQWIGWATGIIMFAFVVIVDFMFFDDSSFIFEPDIKNYARRTAPTY